ncbi:MAG: phosphoribosylanthranilate isomerase, partial [Pyrinomonadaceae bacterium]
LRYKDQTPRERTWTIHFISITKVIKGLILVAVGIKLLSLIGRDVEAWATDFVSRHGIDLANRYVHAAIEKLQGVSSTQLMQMSGVAFGYSCLLFTEGVGLWLQKRWAEYLTAIATSLFIPLELYEIFERFTWVRIGILALNLFIVWYLVNRLKDEKAEQHKTRIKICGITNLEDAMLAVSAGADELGFNFFEGSPRYVPPETASVITGRLPADSPKVGVFVNQTAERVLEIASVTGLNAIQLHGDEDAAFINEIRKSSELTIIKVLRVSPQFEPTEAVLFGADAILLDSYSSNEKGGTGATFDWDIAKHVSNLVPVLYLAGGLTPENVSEAIKQVRPYAVDVCSRIESTPGKKDEDKLRRFIAAVRKAI